MHLFRGPVGNNKNSMKFLFQHLLNLALGKVKKWEIGLINTITQWSDRLTHTYINPNPTVGGGGNLAPRVTVFALVVSTDISVDFDTFVNSYFGLSFDLRR